MLNDKADGTKTSVAVFWATLFALSVLASCGGGGGGAGGDSGGGGGSTPPPPGTTAAPAITSLTEPHTIAFNTQTSIAWTSSGASSCKLYDTTAPPVGVISTAAPRITPVVDSGTAKTWTTPTLTASATYTLECVDAAAASTQQAVTVTVTPLAVITYFNASQSTIASGQPVIFSWSSMHSDRCSLAWSGASNGSTTDPLPPVSGDRFITHNPTAAGAHLYVLTCSGAPGTNDASQTQDVTVIAAPPPVMPSITQFLSQPPTITSGQSTTLSWISANSTSCELSAGGTVLGVFTVVPGVPGSFSVSPAATTTYNLTCTGAAGTPASQNTTITVYSPSPPTASISATPPIITVGQSATVTWSSTYSNSCRFTAGTGTDPAVTLAISGAFTTPVFAAPASITYTVECTGPGGTVLASATVTVNLAGGGGCTADVTPGATTFITTPSNIAARLNGVAPLSVFFDATGTTHNTNPAIKPFHDLEYRWDFGDPASGTWSNGSKPGISSKNTATGAVAAHVYETPGTYTVTLTVTDGANTVSNNCTQIVVQNPDDIPGVPGVFTGANTVCIGATSLPTTAEGCPAGAIRVVQPNFETAIGNLANPAVGYAKTGKRVLFRRGDTFTAGASNSYTSASLTQTGPGIIGAFGPLTDPAPIVQLTGNGAILYLSSQNTPAIKDWRVMDLDFDGRATYSTAGTSLASTGILGAGEINQVLILNMNMRDIYLGVNFSAGVLDLYNLSSNPNKHALWDQIAIVDSTLAPNSGTTTSYRIYATVKRFAALGNSLGNMSSDVSMGAHTVRTPYIGRGVISNNTIARAGTSASPGLLAIKMHGPTWCTAGSAINPNNGVCTSTSAGYSLASTVPPMGVTGVAGGYTEKIALSDNKIIGGNASELVTLGPQNATSDERVRDVIVERNWFQAGNQSTSFALVIHSVETTVRNNICNMTGGSVSGGTCFEIKLYGATSPAPPPDQIRIYNNTTYKSDISSAAPAFNVVRIDANSTNVAVINNLAHTPSAGTWMPHMINGAATLLAANSSDDQIKNTSPGWIAPAVPSDFRLTAGSYAYNAGTAVPVWSDFFRASRPQSGVPGIDMGAVEEP